MTKSVRILLSLLFAFCLLSPLTAQSQPAASWEDFDNLMGSLKQEIDNLNLQIMSLQNSLTLAQSDLAESQAELQMLKSKQAELVIRLVAYESSLEQSRQLAKNYEIRLQSANRSLIISILANVVLTGGIVYLIAH